MQTNLFTQGDKLSAQDSFIFVTISILLPYNKVWHVPPQHNNRVKEHQRDVCIYCKWSCVHKIITCVHRIVILCTYVIILCAQVHLLWVYIHQHRVVLLWQRTLHLGFKEVKILMKNVNIWSTQDQRKSPDSPLVLPDHNL